MPACSLSSVRRAVASRAESSSGLAETLLIGRGMIARQQRYCKMRSSPSRRAHPSMHPDQVAELIRAALPGADVVVESADQVHFSARIVSPAFAGLRGVARHQLVYRALGERVGREIHALSIEALTPEESRAAPRQDRRHG